MEHQHYNDDYHYMACCYLQGQAVRDFEPRYQKFTKQQVFDMFQAVFERQAIDFKEASIAMSHYLLLSCQANKFKQRDIGCGRLYEPDYGVETCDLVWVLDTVCDCRGQNDWVTVVSVDDLLHNHYFDYISLPDNYVYRLPNGEQFNCHTVRREFRQQSDVTGINAIDELGYVYYPNMRHVPKSARLDSARRPAYSWGSKLYPETDLSVSTDIRYVELNKLVV